MTASENTDRSDKGSGADEITLDELLEDYEVRMVRDMLIREKKGGCYPDSEDIRVMEEPLRNVLQISLLFFDLVIFGPRDRALNLRGLAHLALALRSEAGRLYRLYHGHEPRD